jgi:uncharacterized membrane protein HdeD (DUF308 family)
MRLAVETTYLIRGILAILCGLIFLFWSARDGAPTGLVFLTYFFLEGVAALVFGVEGGARWYLLGGSVVNLVAAGLIFVFVTLLSMVFPGTTTILLLYIVCSRIVLIGLLELLAGVFRRQAAAAYLRAAIGALSVVFGLVLVSRNGKDLHDAVRALGIYFVALGVALAVVSLRARAAARQAASRA